MVNRVEFIENVNGIKYPEMLVDFFDHFVALKQIVEDTGTVTVLNSENTTSIEFSILFSSSKFLNKALSAISANGGVIVIYGRTMTINLEVLTDIELKIKLY